MNNKYELIYEGKAKKVFSHDDKDKVLIEFKDDATAVSYTHLTLPTIVDV